MTKKNQVHKVHTETTIHIPDHNYIREQRLHKHIKTKPDISNIMNVQHSTFILHDNPSLHSRT
jgi:hypothetical protein